LSAAGAEEFPRHGIVLAVTGKKLDFCFRSGHTGARQKQERGGEKDIFHRTSFSLSGAGGIPSASCLCDAGKNGQSKHFLTENSEQFIPKPIGS
jgi:hypothetical protein